jgi:carbamoyltransferase
MYILGVWDGHDSGAVLIESNRIIFAANEERFTKRKLEIKFPYNSIKAALNYEGIKPSDVDIVAFATTEFTKTFSRIFPEQKEKYYAFRRRKMLKPTFEPLMHYTKYAMTSIGPLPMCGITSKFFIKKELKSIGFNDDITIEISDHHASHAATAAFPSGFKKAIILTIDGLGDGKSGSVSILNNGQLELQSSIKAADSIGIFYEQVTNILGMRELEDEGKVMAMADYSFPFNFNDNKLKDFITVQETGLKAKFGPISQYNLLNRIAWSTPKEQFAYMAQQLLENTLQKLSENLVEEYGINDIALSGGIMSNVKSNMKIREGKGIKNIFVFPHMGDGGIAMGAAMDANYRLNGVNNYSFNDIYLGPKYTNKEIKKMIKSNKKLHIQEDNDVSRHAAELISDDHYILWFQGRMEYGPRALGNRSILAKPDSEYVKDKLNLYVKQREWFQPFCPSMLEDDARKFLEDVKEPNRFMTMAYKVKKSAWNKLGAVMHIDHTARPQMVGKENPKYLELLNNLKKLRGYGTVLNTSFNIHGAPIVMNPEDALKTMINTKTRYMFIGDNFIENLNGDM